MSVDLPPGWLIPFPSTSPEWATKVEGTDRISIEADHETIRIEWTDTRDDHFGTTQRSVTVPTSVVLALLAGPGDDASEVPDAE